MAGNHSKKSTERRDSSAYKQQQQQQHQQQQHQQQRKNSSGGPGMKKDNILHSNSNPNNNNNKLLNNQKAQQAAGAAILSAVTSPQASGLIQPQQQSVGLNGFNRGDLVEFLNMRFSAALTAYHDTNLDPTMRPEKYESAVKPPQNAWSKNGVHNAWGQQPKQPKGDTTGVMANGVDFLTELSNRSSK